MLIFSPSSYLMLRVNTASSEKYFKTISKLGSNSSLETGSFNFSTDVSLSIINVNVVGTGPSSEIF